MSVPCLVIADAVVAALNAAELSIAFEATREYVPRFAKENVSTLQVCVVPTQEKTDGNSRGSDKREVTIDIGVVKQLAARTAATEAEAEAAEKAETDAILELCEEIKATINKKRLPGAEGAFCAETVQKIPCSVKGQEEREFIALITATFITTVAT